MGTLTTRRGDLATECLQNLPEVHIEANLQTDPCFGPHSAGSIIGAIFPSRTALCIASYLRSNKSTIEFAGSLKLRMLEKSVSCSLDEAEEIMPVPLHSRWPFPI